MANILVEATEKGYYDHKRRYPGERFWLVDRKKFVRNPKGRSKGHFEPVPAERQFSEKWMVKVDDPAAQPTPAPRTPEVPREPIPISEATETGATEKRGPGRPKGTGSRKVL